MKFLLLIAMTLALSSLAQAYSKMECQNGQYKIVVTPYCQLPLSSLQDFMDSGKTQQDKNNRTSIKIYKKGKLVDNASYNCYGPYEQDSAFLVTNYYNDQLSLEVSYFDDWGMQSSLRVFLTAAKGTKNQKDIIFEDGNCKIK